MANEVRALGGPAAPVSDRTSDIGADAPCRHVSIPITVVIATFNRPHALARTIRTMMQQTGIPAEIVIVDQSSSSSDRATNRALTQEISHQTKVVYLVQDAPSLTAARNLGFKHCTNEVIVFADDDVDVEPSTLAKVWERMATSEVALIAGMDSLAAHSASIRGYVSLRRSFPNRNLGHVTWSMVGQFPLEQDADTETQWAMGFFFAIRRSLVERWGIRWDEALQGYAYAEDLDFSFAYCNQARLEKLSCLMTPDVRVAHLGTLEYRIPSRLHTYMFVVHREYLSYKHFSSPRARIATTWTNMSELGIRLLRRRGVGDFLGALLFLEENRSLIRSGRLPEFPGEGPLG